MELLSIKEKSLKININSNYFGTIAEIGGGQETARNLFQAGGASNSIAKSISAYDKRYSDHFYNKGETARYVDKSRLVQMLHWEYQELLNVIKSTSGNKKFYAFANTVETLNFHKTNQGHGWVGVAFQGSSLEEPNVIYLHIKLKENDATLQQYSIGAVGVNLIYGAFFNGDDPKKMITSVMDSLSTDRLDLDYVHVEGPDFKNVDNRLLNLFLVSSGLTSAIMFDKDGNVQQPSDMLYKKNVLAFRGFFRPINMLGMEIIGDSMEKFSLDPSYTEENTITFCEIALNNLMQGQDLDENDFLNRVDILNAMGQCVMVSKFKRFFSLTEYFTQFKMNRLRLVMGTPTFLKVLDKKYYEDLRGGLLEAMGRMFSQNMKIYIYPTVDQITGKVIFPNDLPLPEDVHYLLKYLEMNRRIVKLQNAKTEYQYITTDRVNELMETASPELSEVIPQKVEEIIKTKELFGYGTKA